MGTEAAGSDWDRIVPVRAMEAEKIAAERMRIEVMTRGVAVVMAASPSGQEEGETSRLVLLGCGSVASLQCGMKCRKPTLATPWADDCSSAMFGKLRWRLGDQPAQSPT